MEIDYDTTTTPIMQAWQSKHEETCWLEYYLLCIQGHVRKISF